MKYKTHECVTFAGRLTRVSCTMIEISSSPASYVFYFKSHVSRYLILCLKSSCLGLQNRGKSYESFITRALEYVLECSLCQVMNKTMM